MELNLLILLVELTSSLLLRKMRPLWLHYPHLNRNQPIRIDLSIYHTKGNRLIKVHISTVLNHNQLLQKGSKSSKDHLTMNLEDQLLDIKNNQEEVVRIINLSTDHQ